MSLTLQAAKYGAVGLINTAVGVSVIFALMAFGVGDFAANAGGFAVGLVVSYALNSRWTFRHRGAAGPAALRFAAVIAVAYAVNLAVLVAARAVLGPGSHLAQLIGVAAYAVIGFVGSRAFAFR